MKKGRVWLSFNKLLADLSDSPENKVLKVRVSAALCAAETR